MINAAKLFTLTVAAAGLLGVAWIIYVLAPVILKEPTVYDPAEQGVVIGQSRFDFPHSAYSKLSFEKAPRGNQSVATLRLKYPEMSGLISKDDRNLKIIDQHIISIFNPIINDTSIVLPVDIAQASLEYRTRIWMNLPQEISLIDILSIFKLSQRYGLTRLQAKDDYKYPNVLAFALKNGHELYLEKNGENSISTSIQCSSKLEAPIPTCRLWFRIEDVVVKIVFSNSRLPEWKTIKQATTKYIIRYRKN